MKLLGAAIGDAEFCGKLARKRIEKAETLMSKIGEINDCQAGLFRLRTCASYAKLMYNARTTPANLQ